jgi:hypothetical protein
LPAAVSFLSDLNLSRETTMKRVIVTSVILMCGLAAAAGVYGGGSAAPAPCLVEDDPQCPNAAVSYLHGAELIRTSGKAEQFAGLEWSALAGKTDWKDLPAEFKTAYEDVPRQAIRSFLAGTRKACCEFHIDWDEGIHAFLPHLGPIRQLARVVRVDARGQLADGDVDGAAERIAGLYRMGTHLSSDRLLISCLVGAAIASLANQEVEAMVASGRLSPEAREVLRRAMDAMPDDPFGFRPTLRGERRWTLGWISREFRGPDAGRQLVKALHGMWDSAETPQEMVIALSLLDEAGLAREIERMDGFYVEVARVWDWPNAVEELERLDQRCGDGEFGLLAPVAAAFSKAKAAEIRIQTETSRIRKLLEEPAR